MALAGACLQATTPVRNPSLPVVSYELEQYQSGSGMRVVLEHTADTGSAGAVLVIGAGAADNDAARAGLAHLTEHLAFDAHPGEAAPLWRRFETLGAGAYNGMTSWDSTTYVAYVPQQNLPNLLSSLAGLLKDPLAGVDDTDFTVERQIVKNELRFRSENGTPSQALGWLMEATFPPRHPYAQPIVGKAETLDRMTLADAREFASRHYLPDAATLVVQSPLPTSAQRELVERVFGGIRAPSAPPKSATVGALEGPANELREYSAAIAAPIIWIGWSLPGVGAEPKGMSTVLGQLASWAVLENGEQRHHDISRIDAHYISGERASLLALEVSLKAGDDPAGAAQAAIRDTIQGLSTLTHVGFETRRFALASAAGYELEGLVPRGLGLARAAEYFHDARRAQQRAAEMLALGAPTLADYFATYLTAARAHLVLVRPLSTTASLQQAQSSLEVRETEQRHVEKWPAPDSAQLGAWMSRRDSGAYRTRTLANGLEVVVVPRPGASFHTVMLGFHGGSSYGMSGAGIATFWSRLGYVSPFARGLQSRLSLEPDSLTRGLRGVGRDLSTTLSVLRESILHFEIRWPPETFINQMERFEREEQTPQARLARARRQALFQTHAYGSEATVADMRKISAADVHDWLAGVERPENAELVIAGDFDPNGVFQLVEEMLGGWERGQAATAPLSAPPALSEITFRGNRLIVGHAPSVSQAKVEITCALPPSSADTWPTYDVFKEMLAARLFGALRRKEGASYSVSGRVELLRGGTALLHVSADVDPFRIQTAFHEIRTFVDRKAADLFDDASVEQARFDVGTHYNLAADTSWEAAGRALLPWSLDWPLDAVARYPERLLALRRDQVLRIAEHCRANWMVSVLGDEPKVRAAWAGAQ